MLVEHSSRGLGDHVFIDQLLNKKLHLACIAMHKMTFLNTFAVLIGGMNPDDAERFTDSVNKNNSSASLFPNFNLTLIPKSIYRNRNDFGNFEMIYTHIKKCFDINRTSVKSPELVFAFESREIFDVDSAVISLLKISKEIKGDLNLKKVSYIIDTLY